MRAPPRSWTSTSTAMSRPISEYSSSKPASSSANTSSRSDAGGVRREIAGPRMFYAQLAVNGLVQGLVVGLAALSITLVFGIARFPNAATGDAMTLGAYSGLVVHRDTGSLALGSLASVGAAALVLLLAYVAVFRRLAGRSVVALLVASIGVGFVVRAALGVAFGHSQLVFQLPLARPYVVGGLRITPLDLQLAGIAAVALAVVFAILYLTPI